MGKAGTIVIIFVVVLAILALFWGIGAFAKWMERDPQEPKKIRQNAGLTDEAFELIRDILVPKSLDGDVSYLSNDHAAKAKAWAAKYRKVNS